MSDSASPHGPMSTATNGGPMSTTTTTPSGVHSYLSRHGHMSTGTTAATPPCRCSAARYRTPSLGSGQPDHRSSFAPPPPTRGHRHESPRCCVEGDIVCTCVIRTQCTRPPSGSRALSVINARVCARVPRLRRALYGGDRPYKGGAACK